jgi:hypothetical protein
VQPKTHARTFFDYQITAKNNKDIDMLNREINHSSRRKGEHLVTKKCRC